MNGKNILIVAATDLSDDNSASLCHTAYIRGFVKAGHTVTVLTVSPTSLRYNHEVDGAEYVYVSDETALIRHIRESRKKKTQEHTDSQSNKAPSNSFVKRSVSLIKKSLLNIAIKVCGATLVWRCRVSKLKFSEKFNLTISLSSPPESHNVVGKLIRKRRINTIEWCQLWEDPWSTDLYEGNSKVYKKEKRLLDIASKVLYVSPLTLARQKELFPENANKMDWLPLPTYFEENNKITNDGTYTFGYFGQYFPYVRNLQPTYEALNELKQKFFICGEPHEMFEPTVTTEIHARVTPDELKEFEKKTNVLVFVSNLGGGQIPGKIYQYSGTDKWILFVLDGNDNEKNVLSNYFSQFNRYVFCENNKESIVAAVQSIISGQISGVRNERISYFESANIANEILLKTQSTNG